MVTLITPTRNRPQAFDLLQTWIERQTYGGPLQWIVVNDGSAPYDYRLGQTVLNRVPTLGEKHSLCMNLLEGLPHVQGEKLLFVEDDDYLAPAYVERLVSWLDDADLAGGCPALYYNLSNRCFRELPNLRHASLGQTGVRRKLLDWLVPIIARGNPYIDLAAWRRCPRKSVLHSNRDEAGRPLHISMKNLPGERGIGNGHVLRTGVIDDEFSFLREMIGDEPASHYERLAPPLQLEEEAVS